MKKMILALSVVSSLIFSQDQTVLANSAEWNTIIPSLTNSRTYYLVNQSNIWTSKKYLA